MAGDARDLRADLARVRELAGQVEGDGPAEELGRALADAVLDLAGRVDALWELITAVVSAAGPAAAPATAPAGPPPPEFLQAVNAARGSGPQGLRLSIGGREWVAALSQDQRPADPAGAWAALERVAAAQAGEPPAAGQDRDQDDR